VFGVIPEDSPALGCAGEAFDPAKQELKIQVGAAAIDRGHNRFLANLC